MGIITRISEFFCVCRALSSTKMLKCYNLLLRYSVTQWITSSAAAKGRSGRTGFKELYMNITSSLGMFDKIIFIQARRLSPRQKAPSSSLARGLGTRPLLPLFRRRPPRRSWRSSPRSARARFCSSPRTTNSTPGSSSGSHRRQR